MKFMDSYRFMPSPLSSLVDNLPQGLHSEKCSDCKCHLDYMSIKDYKLVFRCFECKKDYQKEFNKELIKRFANVYEFCNKSINRFIFLLRKGVYPYEYMDNWKRFDETSLPDKKAFYSNLIERITDADYRHVNNVFKTCGLTNLGEYHDLHVQCNTLLLANVFENFRNLCIKVYELLIF